MKTPKEGGAWEARDLDKPPRNSKPPPPATYNVCIGCGITFAPRADYHRLCPKCWRYRVVAIAIGRFRLGDP